MCVRWGNTCGTNRRKYEHTDEAILVDRWVSFKCSRGFDISCVVTFVQQLKVNIFTDYIMKVGAECVVMLEPEMIIDQGFLYWLNWFIGETNCSPGIQGLFQELVGIPRNTCCNSSEYFGLINLRRVWKLVAQYTTFSSLVFFRIWTLCNFCRPSHFRISIKISICAITEESHEVLPFALEDWNWSNFALGLELIKHKDDTSASFVTASVNLISSSIMVR